MFPENSRYQYTEKTTMKGRDGKKIAYLRRRFIPPPEKFELLQEHTVTEGDRLDNITAVYLGDAEMFWRVADANNAMKPEDLTKEVGRKIKITLPNGTLGVTNV